MVHVVVRVQVGGEGADELQEPRDLPLYLRVDAFGVVRGELHMQPQAQDRTLSSEGGRRLARRSVHQEARAREDPAMVCLDDAQVDARTHSEIVPGDDEPLHERVPLAPAATSDRSAPAAGSGRSARLTARACSRTRATTWRESNSSASSRASREWC